MVLQSIQYLIPKKKTHLKSMHTTYSVLLCDVFLSLKLVSRSPKSITIFWRKKIFSFVRTFKFKHASEINVVRNYVINVIKPILI